MTRLLIARHGNTFARGELPLRVGARTDLPLVESGILQAQKLGHYLEAQQLRPQLVYSSQLKRAYDTAHIALQTAALTSPIITDAMFNEIDYGPDEAQPESAVMARIGQEAITAWDKEALVPAGWNVDPALIIRQWQDFAANICETHPASTVLVVTSNGIARFAPHITGNFAQFLQDYSIKIATGAICSFIHDGKTWQVEYWNHTP
jgi:2,3-bisphosphoglycerate-dependent phosphoglycerate mutase